MMKKRLSAIIGLSTSLAIMAICIMPLVLLSASSNSIKDNSQAITTTDTTSYVSVGELWDSTSKSFNEDNVNILYKYIAGDANASFGDVSDMAQGTTTAAEIRGATLSASSNYSEKTSSQDIVVTLGGLKWEVVYLSYNNDQEPILTLWLSNSTQDAFAGRSVTEGNYYGYINSGLYSKWSANWATKSPYVSYPENMYGTSYIRAVTLNNGGSYATSNSELISVEKNSNNVFAPFTMDEYGLTKYIERPTNMLWQNDQSIITTLNQTYTYQNEGIDPGTINWYSSEFDYSRKTGYINWESDYLWLPSLTEIGNLANGLWAVSNTQRQNSTTNSTASIGNVGATSSVARGYLWLRSGYYTHLYGDLPVCYLNPSGQGYNATSPNNAYAIRPAFHLNLKAVQKSFPYWDNHASDEFAGGTGTAEDPYQIATAEQLAHLAVISQASTASGYYKLTADIDLREHLWTGINFGGVFDGAYHRIYGMSTVSSNYNVGLFLGAYGGTIKNVFLTDSTIRANGTYVGGLCGVGYGGTIINCVLDNVNITNLSSSATSYASGILGYSGGHTISNCIFQNGSITGYRVSGISGSGASTNCAVINTTLQSESALDVDNIYAIANPFAARMEGCYGEVLVISGNNSKFIKEMYGTDWSGFMYSMGLNYGYPIPKELLTIGSVASDATAVYNRLKELGFVEV